MTPEVLAIEREVDQLKADGKFPEAIAKMQEALAIDDTFARGHLTLSVLYGKVDEYLKSVEHAERVIELEPNDKFNYVAISEVYRRAFEGTRDETFIAKAEDAKARASMGG
jgi:tetratricopeptide (TPR) repeat protein